MESVVAVRECMWCHEPYYLSDGRYKYCSDECAEKARLARRKENFSKIEKPLSKKEQELILRILSAKSKTSKNISNKKLRRKRERMWRKNAERRRKLAKK